MDGFELMTRIRQSNKEMRMNWILGLRHHGNRRPDELSGASASGAARVTETVSTATQQQPVFVMSDRVSSGELEALSPQQCATGTRVHSHALGRSPAPPTNATFISHPALSLRLMLVVLGLVRL